MKKILTLLLSALMLLSLVTVSVGAATEVKDEIIVSNFDLATGWNGFALDGMLRGNGDSCISKKVEAPIENVGGFLVSFKSDKTYDISGKNAVVMDLYVSDAETFNSTSLCFELSSSGMCDYQEIQGMAAAMALFGPLKDGWNKVTVTFEKLNSKTAGKEGDLVGPFDPTRWNFFRMFNMAPVGVGDEPLVVAIDNFGFANVVEESSGESADALDAEEMKKTDTKVPLYGCNTPWGSFILDRENKVAGSASCSYVMSSPMTARKVLTDPVNATGMDTLEMDLYFSNLDIMKIDFGEATFEMSSSGIPDGAELYIFFADLFGSIQNPKVGWNHVAIPLSSMKMADIAKKGEFDISNINHIGIYWTKCGTETKGMLFAIDNICLTNGAAELEKAEESAVEAVVAAVQAVKNLKKANINADNYEATKAQVEAARAAYDALSASGKALADGKACAVNLSSAERAILSYERDLERAEEPNEPTEPDTPAEPDTPDTPSEPDTPDEPDTPAEPDEPTTPDAPKTESNGAMMLIIVIVVVTLVIVIGVAVACVLILKKKNA